MTLEFRATRLDKIRDKRLLSTPNANKSKYKGPLSDVKQLLTIEGPLKMVKNAFLIMLKALCVLVIFNFLS